MDEAKAKYDEWRAGVIDWFKAVAKHRMKAHLCTADCLKGTVEEAKKLLAAEPPEPKPAATASQDAPKTAPAAPQGSSEDEPQA